jgi:hypothetical protein
VLERAEDMLNGTSADGHGVRFAVEPTLHHFKHILVLPSPNSTISGGDSAGTMGSYRGI